MLIRIVLVDNHTLFRQGLRALLEGQPDMAVVGEAQNGRRAQEVVSTSQPDVVLIDLTLPELNGLEVTRRLRKKHPTLPVVALSMHAHDESIFRFLQAGGQGYVLKQSSLDVLTEAIRTVIKGEVYLDPALPNGLLEEYVVWREEVGNKSSRYDTLTNREREVLQLIAEGYTNREIAQRLSISIKTVDTHRTNLMRKLDIHDRVGLTKYAIRQGLIDVYR